MMHSYATANLLSEGRAQKTRHLFRASGNTNGGVINRTTNTSLFAPIDSVTFNTGGPLIYSLSNFTLNYCTNSGGGNHATGHIALLLAQDDGAGGAAVKAELEETTVEWEETSSSGLVIVPWDIPTIKLGLGEAIVVRLRTELATAQWAEYLLNFSCLSYIQHN